MACYGNIMYGPSVDVGPLDLNANAVLPTTGKPQLNIETVYADDGVTVMYYEYSLSISVLIYLQTSTQADIEAEVRRLKGILSTPGQKLKIYPVGLGELPTVNGTVGAAGVANVPDVKGGPYPQSVEVVPDVTNEAITVSWSVMFRILHCPDAVLRDLIQFNSEIDIDTNDDGDVTFAIRSTYQTKNAITDKTNLYLLADHMLLDGSKVFQGMKRRRRISFSRDQRIAHILVEYKEIASDNAFFPYTKNIEATDELSSDLMAKSKLQGAGFYTWTRKISATIRLPKRVHKVWAFVIWKRILSERLRRLGALTKQEALKVFGMPANQEGDIERNRSWFINTRIAITNPIYSREVKFEYEYLVCTDLLTLMSKSLILSRVNTKFVTTEPYVPSKLSDQWLAWELQNEALKTGNTDRPVAITGEYWYESTGPIVVEQCLSYSSNPPDTTKFGPTRPKAGAPLEDDPDAPDTSYPTDTHYSNEPKDISDKISQNVNWLDYTNDFEIIQHNNNVQARYLQEVGNSYYQDSSSDGPLKTSDGFVLDNKVIDPDESFTRAETISRGNSSFQIRMKGMALRAGSKIPIPTLQSVNGNLVSRTGKSRVSQTVVSPGTTPVYMAMWDITYNVNGNIYSADILPNIKTTGDPSYYS